MLPQTGSLSEAFRFSPKGTGQVLGQLERRKGVGPTDLGHFMYDPSKGSLNTVALDGTIPADQIRLQVMLGFSSSTEGDLNFANHLRWQKRVH